jgi:hypothetical protein
MCLERQFKEYEDVSSFCSELVDGGSEGLNDCVGGYWGMGLLADKTPLCYRFLTCSQTKNLYRNEAQGSWVRRLAEDTPYKYWCSCNTPDEECDADEVLEWNRAIRVLRTKRMLEYALSHV